LLEVVAEYEQHNVSTLCGHVWKTKSHGNTVFYNYEAPMLISIIFLPYSKQSSSVQKTNYMLSQAGATK